MYQVSVENDVSFHIVCNHSFMIPMTFCGDRKLRQLDLKDSTIPGIQLVPRLTSEVTCHCIVRESRRKDGVCTALCRTCLLGLAATLLVSLRR